jgi:preprotein translocase subunit SecG
LLNLVILVTGAFLILLILIQRGRGGGLIGALGGGAGGSSPFGSRAGDTFTRITIGVAVFWIALQMIQIKVIQL